MRRRKLRGETVIMGVWAAETRSSVQPDLNSLCTVFSQPLHTAYLSVSWLKSIRPGIPAMVDWVKNPTAMAQVTVEVQIRSPAWHSGLQDIEVLAQRQRRLLWLRFSPWPGNVQMAQVWP